MTFGLDGAVVLVTGGARGVGAGVTRAFLRAGARVITCARRDPETPIDGSTHLRCDVRDPDQVTELIGDIVGSHGRLDVLVNNAGGAPPARAADASPRFHSKIVELNLLSPLLVSQAANTVMQRQLDGGSIVMVSSVSAVRPSPGTAAYGAAKAGLNNLTASLAVEWAPKVRVNALGVGMVRTELSELHYGDAAGIESVGRTVPLGRLAEPEEIGECAVFLASPRASYVSGATLLVHGGGEVPAFLAAGNAEFSAVRRPGVSIAGSAASEERSERRAEPSSAARRPGVSIAGSAASEERSERRAEPSSAVRRPGVSIAGSAASEERSERRAEPSSREPS